MHFGTKIYLKSTYNHTVNHALPNFMHTTCFQYLLQCLFSMKQLGINFAIRTQQIEKISGDQNEKKKEKRKALPEFTMHCKCIVFYTVEHHSPPPTVHLSLAQMVFLEFFFRSFYLNRSLYVFIFLMLFRNIGKTFQPLNMTSIRARKTDSFVPCEVL